MFPNDISKLIDQLTGPVLLREKVELNNKWTRSAEQSAQAGLAGSGAARTRLVLVHFDHYRDLAEQLWQCIKRVTSEGDMTPYPGLASDLVMRFDSLMTAPTNRIRSSMHDFDLMGKTACEGEFEKVAAEVQQKYHTEIELLARRFSASSAKKDIGQGAGQGTFINASVTGDNSRVLVGSTDNSINIKNSDAIFGALVQAIQKGVADTSQQAALLAAANEMSIARREPRGLWQSYCKFMSIAGDHFSVVSPFLPAITQLLTS